MGTLEKRSSVSRISRISRISRYLLQKRKKLNYFYKISLRIPTILVRDFSRFEVERNYDEVGKRFFLDFLKF
jgi:hypothetical protein